MNDMKDAVSRAAWIVCPGCTKEWCPGKGRCKKVADYIEERAREKRLRPTKAQADAIHREALAEQHDQFAASVMLGSRAQDRESGGKEEG